MTSCSQSGRELEMCLVIVTLLLTFFPQNFSCDTYHRLLSPASNSQLQIVPKIEVPLAMAPTVQSGMNLKLPITLKFPGRQDKLQKLDKCDHEVAKTKSRALFYKSIDKVNPSFGKICLLRSICEVSHIPLISPATGLVGEIIDTILS